MVNDERALRMFAGCVNRDCFVVSAWVERTRKHSGEVILGICRIPNDTSKESFSSM